MLQKALDKTLKHQGITGKQIAEHTGISPSYVSEIRSGKRNPSLEMFERLLNGAEEIAPGSLEYFAMCLPVEASLASTNIDYLAVNLNDEEFASLVIARNKYLRSLASRKNTDSLVCSLVT